MGPSWLNYVKSGLFLTGIVMIFMTLNDPGNLGLIYGIVGVSCLLGILFVFQSVAQICPLWFHY